MYDRTYFAVSLPKYFSLDFDISYKRIWQIAYPIILGSVAQNLINVTDTAYLGRVGQVELGASALGGIFYFVFIMLGLGFGTGAQIIMARRFGEGNNHAIGKTFDHALYFILPLALVAFLVLFIFAPAILRPMVQSDSIYQATLQYLDFRVYGIFFAFLQILFRSFYIGISNTTVITSSTLLMAGINIVLDYVMIFGKWGFPEMGIQGAALASSISEACAVVYLFVYTWRKQHHKTYQLFEFKAFDRKLFNRNFELSAPIMVQNFFSLGVWFVFFLLVEKMGEQALAVSNIIRSIYIVLMIPIWGFASAANSLVSYLIGLQHSDKVFTLIKRIVWLSLGGVLVIVLLSMIFPSLIIRVYTEDPDLIKIAVPVLYVVDVGSLALSVGFVVFNGLIGTGRTMIGLFIELLTLAFYLFYVWLLTSVFRSSVAMVWTSEIIYGGFMIVLSSLYLKFGKWQSQTI